MFRKLGLWGFLAGLIVLGVGLLVFASAVALPRPLRELVPSVGASLLIGGILGASVDRWLKARLLRDAFKSLFGYVLPEQLRTELDWVYTRELLCDRSDLTLRLIPIRDSDLITVGIEWHRDLRNITSHTVSWRPTFSLDEWFHDGHPSRITSLVATLDGNADGEVESGSPDPFSVETKLKRELLLKPDESLTVVSEAEETRHVSDAWFLNLMVATANPRVTVHAPDSMAWCAMFGNRQPVREIGPVTRELPGTLLPGQVIQIRWWPSNAVASGIASESANGQGVETRDETLGSHPDGATGSAAVLPP
jgi:hypothetical protein